MPKKVFDAFVKKVTLDVRAHYHVGERYLTVRQVAEKFKVAYATAHKGLRFLEDLGMFTAVPCSGILVKSLETRLGISGNRVVVLSFSGGKLFNDAIADGVRSACAPHGITVDIGDVSGREVRSLSFGDHLLGLGADGIVAASFDDSALAFYHAMMNGQDIVSNVPLAELPLLPVVHTDNARHAAEAARFFAEKGITEVLVGSSRRFDGSDLRRFFHDRFLGFDQEARSRKLTVRYVHLFSPDAVAALDSFFSTFSRTKAVFSLEMVSNHILAAQFLRYGAPVRGNNFAVYDTLDSAFVHQGLPHVRAFAPSCRALGAAMARKLIDKWKTGRFTEPLCEKI